MISRTALDALRARDATCYTASRPQWTTAAGSTVAPVVEFFVSELAANKRATQWDCAAPLEAPDSVVQPIRARAIPREHYQPARPVGRLARALRKLHLLG